MTGVADAGKVEADNFTRSGEIESNASPARRRLRIGIMTDALAVGGAERQAILCVSELRKLGHSADLIYYRPAKEYGAMLEDLQIEPVYIAGDSFFHRCRLLRALFRERNYDAVHGFKRAAEVYSAVAGTQAGVPCRLGSIRGIYDFSLRYRILHYLVDKFLSGWVVNSKAAAESMSRNTRISPQRIVVLQNGVYAGSVCDASSSQRIRDSLGLGPDAIVISMIARLIPSKNHRLLIDSAIRVIRQASHARFLVVGKGPLKKELEDYAAAQGVSDKVLFLGQRSDIAGILAATDIAALTTNLEGLPNAIIEAMAAGKPIACTNYPGCEEIMSHGETAMISPCGDADAFAKSMLGLIRDESLRLRLARNAAKYADDHFSPEAMARNLESIYLRHLPVGHPR